MNKELKPLSKVIEIVSAISLNVSHAYEDLVIIEENPFLLRFDLKDPENVYIHFNTDCAPTDTEDLIKQMTPLAESQGLRFVKADNYSMNPNEETNEIEIQFIH